MQSRHLRVGRVNVGAVHQTHVSEMEVIGMAEVRTGTWV